MEKLKLHLLDTNKIDITSLICSSYIKEDQISSFLKYKNERARNEKIASTYLKNKYIGSYSVDEHGKPINKDKYFNVSHSDGLVCLIIDEHHPIGVDIEKVKQIKDDFVKYVTSKEEQQFIKEDKDFYYIWTNKESLLKAYGSGIEKELKEIPSLPLNSLRFYKGFSYKSLSFCIDEYVISVTRKGIEEFDIEIIKEEIK